MKKGKHTLSTALAQALTVVASVQVGTAEATEYNGPSNHISYIGENHHCMPAASIKPDIFPYGQAPNTMALIADLVDEIGKTELGAILIANNIENDVTYCVVGNDFFDPHKVLGVYSDSRNAVYLVHDKDYSYDSYFTTMSEEIAHATQWHTNPILLDGSRDHYKLFDQYAFDLGIEAQAKIWAAQIKQQYNAIYPNFPIEKTDGSKAESVVTYAAETCFEIYQQPDVECLTDAFSQIMKKDNAYTSRDPFQVLSRAITHFNNGTTRTNAVDMPSSTYIGSLGYLPAKDGKITFLKAGFNAESLYDISQGKPDNIEGESWRTGNYMRLADGDITTDENRMNFHALPTQTSALKQ